MKITEETYTFASPSLPALVLAALCAVAVLFARQRRWLTVERLPGYAPDLNPVEVLWGNIKGQELANRCPDDLGDVAAALRAGMARVRRRPTLARAFLTHAGLSF